jgi:hypothetical protein
MLIIKSVDPATTVPVLLGMPKNAGMPLSQWRAFCQERGLLAFAAERDGGRVGFAVADSCPHRVHVRFLEGDTETCRLLLRRLVLLAGERDMTARVPCERDDVQEMLGDRGFVRQGVEGCDDAPSFFYPWSRLGTALEGLPALVAFLIAAAMLPRLLLPADTRTQQPPAGHPPPHRERIHHHQAHTQPEQH